MSSAYVVDPDKPMDIPILAGDLWRKKVFESIKANTLKGIATRIPQAVPPGTGEAAYPGMESRGNDLPSREFFIKTLDRPHYPDGVGMDQRGHPIDRCFQSWHSKCEELFPAYPGRRAGDRPENC